MLAYKFYVITIYCLMFLLTFFTFNNAIHSHNIQTRDNLHQLARKLGKEVLKTKRVIFGTNRVTNMISLS